MTAQSNLISYLFLFCTIIVSGVYGMPIYHPDISVRNQELSLDERDNFPIQHFARAYFATGALEAISWFHKTRDSE